MTNTAEQILETSRFLFNEQGIENVAISQIAGALSISAGNLTYHFAKKQNIVGSHIRQLEQIMVTTLQKFTFDRSASEFLDSYTELLQVTWNYRYLFNGTTYLLQNALLSKAEYSALVDHIYEIILNQMDKMIEIGNMQSIAKPYDTRTLVDCVWWQWLGWLDANQLLTPDESISTKNLLRNGIEHQMFLISPYLSEPFREELQQQLIQHRAA